MNNHKKEKGMQLIPNLANLHTILIFMHHLYMRLLIFGKLSVT